MQFLNSVYVFKNASHVFDRETYIEKALSTVEMRDGERRIDYRFVDSKDSICVQLSDVIAGLFGKHFNYLQDNTLARLLERKAAFSNRQRETLTMITKLIDRSDDVSDGFFHRVAPMDISFKNDAFLHEIEVPAIHRVTFRVDNRSQPATRENPRHLEVVGCAYNGPISCGVEI